MMAESLVGMLSGTSQYLDVCRNSGFNPAAVAHNHVEYCTSVSGTPPSPDESFSSVIDQSEADIFSAAVLTTFSDTITLSSSASIDASKATQHHITKEGLDHTYQYCVPDKDQSIANAADYSRLSDYLIDSPDPGSIENVDQDRVQIDFFRDDKVQVINNWARFDQPQADEYLYNMPSDSLANISELALAATAPDDQPLPEQPLTQPYFGQPAPHSSISYPTTNAIPSSPDPIEFMTAPDAYDVPEPTLSSEANHGDSLSYGSSSSAILKRIAQPLFTSIEWPHVVNRNDATQFSAAETGMALEHSCHAHQINGGRRRTRYCSSCCTRSETNINHDQASSSTPDGLYCNTGGSPLEQYGSMEGDCGLYSDPSSMQLVAALPISCSNQLNSLPGSAAADHQSKRTHMRLKDEERPPFKKTCRGSMWGNHIQYNAKALYDDDQYGGNAKPKLFHEAETEAGNSSAALLMLHDNLDNADCINDNSSKGNYNASSNGVDVNDKDAPSSDNLEEDYNTANDDSTLCAGGKISKPRRNAKARSKHGGASDPQSVAARHRRERISERLKTLQELVPNGSKVALVTMLEKAINYVKFLQLQVKVLTTDEYWPNSQKLNEPKGANLLNLLMQQEAPSFEFHKSFSKASAKSSTKGASSISNTTTN